MVEHRFCKPAVVGSSPSASSPATVVRMRNGQVAERPMAPDCKSDGLRPTGVRIPPCPLDVEPEWRPDEASGRCGCSSMVEHLPSKQDRGFDSHHPLRGRWSRRSELPLKLARCCSSAVEHFLGKDEVLGSNPSSSSSDRSRLIVTLTSGPAHGRAACFEPAEERWLRTSFSGPSRTSTSAPSATSTTARPP